MAISILDHDKVRALGIDVNTYTHIPPECFIVTYEGAVIDEYERNGSSDSDFYAVVWDETEQTVKSIEYASTRGWTYCNGCKIDASPEVMAKAQAWWRARAIAAEEAHIRSVYKQPYVGATVTVVRGRKVPKGFTGEVVSIEMREPFNGSRYSPTSKEAWALVVNATGSYKVKAEYCDVQPNIEYVERMISTHMSAYRQQIARRETNGRSMLWVGFRGF